MTLAKTLALAVSLTLGLAGRELPAVVPFSGLATDASAVNIHFVEPKAGELEMIKAAGFKRVRVDISWSVTELKKGEYNFSMYDGLVKRLGELDMKAFFILNYANRLYEKQQSVTTDEGRAAFAKWAAAAATHFEGRGIMWEIWSEPNTPYNWAPHPNAPEYAKLAVAACEAIHAATPNECIVGPGTADVDIEFIKVCFNAGLLKWWQGVSIHPYRHSGPETLEVDLIALKKLIAAHAPAGADIPILVSEWGYSSGARNLDATSQAKMLSRQMLTCAAMRLPVSVWYNWRDSGVDPSNPAHRYGLVGSSYRQFLDPVFEPKPTYYAAQTFNRELDGYRFLKRITLGSLEDFGLLFEKRGALCLVVWTNAKPHGIRIPSDDGRYSVVGHVGQVLTQASAAGGVLEMEMPEAPVYVKFEENNALLKGADEAVPAKLQILPSSSQEAMVKLASYSGKPLSGQVEIFEVTGVQPSVTTHDIPASANFAEGIIRFPLASPPTSRVRFGTRLIADGRTVLVAPPRELISQAGTVPVTLKAEAGSNHNVPQRAKITFNEQAPPVPSPAGKVQTWRIQADYPAGSNFVRITLPQPAPQSVAGLDKPGPLTATAKVGIWIYGDNSKVIPRLRMMDAEGRTWQPDGEFMDWIGWKFVEMKLDARTTRWGGSGLTKSAPVGPLTWDTFLLLENAEGTPRTTDIYIQMPYVILD